MSPIVPKDLHSSKVLEKPVAGYGLVEKSVLMDPALSPAAKALYSLLCAYAGHKHTAYPTVSRLTSELVMHRNRFYSALSELIQGELVATEKIRSNGQFSRTLYTLTLRSDGQNTKPVKAPYGKVYRQILTDSRLTDKAKAIYALLTTFAGDKDHCWPPVKLICSSLTMGPDTYRRHLRLLSALGYVRVEQLKKEGRFYNTCFYLSTPAAVSEKTAVTQELSAGTQEPCPAFPGTADADTKTVDILKTAKPKNKHLSLTAITRAEKTPSMDSEFENIGSVSKPERNHGDRSKLEAMVKEQIRYEFLTTVVHPEDNLVDNLTDLMVDLMASRKSTYRIHGAYVSSECLKSALLKINRHHISSLVEALRQVDAPIRNPRAYMISALYASVHTDTLVAGTKRRMMERATDKSDYQLIDSLAG